jgi:hypothetical protein
MKNRTPKIAFFIFFCILLCVLAVMPAFAFHPAEPDYGSVAGGLYVMNGKTELAIESTEIYMDVRDLPLEEYKTAEQLLAYGGQMTATYTLYNPTDHTVYTELLTHNAAASMPWYANELPAGTDAEKYTVEIGGEQVETQTRHVFCYNAYDYTQSRTAQEAEIRSRAYGLKYLSDDYIEEGIFCRHTPVYKYTYSILPKAENKDVYVSATLPEYTGTRMICSGDARFDTYLGYGTQISFLAWNEEVVSFYVIGEDIDALVWKGSTDPYPDKGEPMEIEVTLQDKEEITFEEYCMTGYDAASGCSEVDYYNATLAYLTRNDSYYEYTEGTCYFTKYGLAGDSCLQAMQIFGVTLEPGARTTVTVKSPLYPFVHDYETPPIYTYPIALPAAEQWSACGQLSVHVLTDLRLKRMESHPDYKKFSEIEDGYAYTGEIDAPYLVVSTSKGRINIDFGFLAMMFFLVVILIIMLLLHALPVLLAVVVIAAVIVLIVLLIRRRKKKKAKLKEQENSQATPAGQDASDETDETDEKEDHDEQTNA